MKSKRIFFFFFLTALCIQFAFSNGGALADSSETLHIIQTKYFDIIFPDECRESAKKIEAVCDDYYLEITKILETDAYQRFPVTITRSVELLNAYYAAIPYNRIVLFDTLPDENLDMYAGTIQSVFYHELTHAVTYNMKARPLKALSFFADALNPAWLTVTSFWAEGATVSFESKGRGGRLNDPFSTQIANQAKIEENFPSWRDVTGARDTFPGGTDAYIFGSMFASYLQEKYGMEKYAKFWKKAGSTLTPRFIASVFERAYGKSITQEWKEFEKTLELAHGEKNANLFSHKNSRITSFDVFFLEGGETQIAYYDTASSALRLLTIQKSGKIKNKKLLAITGVKKLTFSPSGKKIAITRTIDRKNYKSVIAEYDLKRKKYKEYGLNEIRGAFFTSNDGQEELRGVQFEGGKALASSVPLLNAEEIPFSPIGIADNLNAAIIKNGLDWKIRLFSENSVLSDFSVLSDELPENNKKSFILHNLRRVFCDTDSVFLSFTWATLGEGGKMLSRAGFLKINQQTMKATAFLQKENGFAGFLEAVPEKKVSEIFSGSNDFSPESIENEEETFLLYVTAAEYEKNPLYSVQMKASDFEETEVLSSRTEYAQKSQSDDKNQNLSQGISFSNEAFSLTSKNPEISYSPFKYYRRGILIPFLGTVPVYNFDFETDTTTILGMTFVSTNPWGDKQISFSGGYDFSYKKGGLQLSLSGGDDSFQYNASGTAIFDETGFMQTAETVLLTKVLWRGKVSAFSAGVQGQYLFGKQIIDEKIEENNDDSIGHSADCLTFVQYSNLHKISPRPYYYLGFTLKPYILASYRTSEKMLESDKFINSGVQTIVRFPILIPFIVTGTLFPSSKYAASASAKAILFDWEIHKGIPAVSLFAQRFVISTTYSCKLSYVHGDFWDIKDTKDIFQDAKKENYSDEIRLSFDFYLSPNTGFLASGDIQIKTGYALVYRPNPKSTEKRIGYGFTITAEY